MKTVLINPPFIFPYRKDRVLSHCLGLRYISSFLKQGGHEVVLIDALKLGFDQISDYGTGVLVGLQTGAIVELIPPDAGLIGISAPFSQLAAIVHEIAAAIKERYPDKRLVLGGVYPSTQPELALTSAADLIVIGEGETAFLKLANGVPPHQIQGVYAPGDAGTRSFLPAEQLTNLDDIPFPDYDIPDMAGYFHRSPRQNRKELTASIITSRGCPFACEFCSVHPVYGRKWRGRSTANVLAEMDLVTSRFGVTNFEFEDDNVTLQRDRAAEIIDGLIARQERHPPLTWSTPNGVRIDTLDEALIRDIVRSGCREIVLALEHGDQEMLALMDKQLDVAKALEIIRMLVRYGMPRIVIFIIVGYPGESESRYRNSLRVLQEIGSLGGNIAICPNLAQPYPGTALFRLCQEKGYLVDPDTGQSIDSHHLMSTGYTVSIVTPEFTREDVLRRMAEIDTLFDSSWKGMLKRLAPLRHLVRKVKGLFS
jgi:radical SAM superfamily enzyme YgiQ (UPF0313 family)